eukprot:scaffold108509_cov12-Tisochrysis_lutea.AAC.1
MLAIGKEQQNDVCVQACRHLRQSNTIAVIQIMQHRRSEGIATQQCNTACISQIGGSIRCA